MAARRLFIIIQDILFFKRSKDRSGDFQDLAIVILAAVEMKAFQTPFFSTSFSSR